MEENVKLRVSALR